MAPVGNASRSTPALEGEARPIPWWKEPTRDQWYAFVAAWLGWTLDAFDFTVFLLIMHPIAQEFGVSMTAVTFVFTITLWMRLLGATASGWIGDRVGRKKPLMIAILGYSLCNFVAGFSPTFMFLFTARAILGLFMGAEWPAGSALAMETWPIRSRGLMSGVLQGSWGLGFLLSFAIYGLFYNSIGWRGMLWVGVLPALAVLYVRFFVREPEVWVENRRNQREQQREIRAPLFTIFKRGMILNTLNTCWFMASGFVLYYSINVLFATHLQVDLKMSPGAIGEIGVAANLVVFLASIALGLGGRQIRSQSRANFAGVNRDTDRAALSPHQRFHAHLVGLRYPGRVWQRRFRKPGPELSRRTVPYRGARDGCRLLLSSGRNLGWPRCAHSRLGCDDLPDRLRGPDVGWYHRRGHQLRCRNRIGTRNERTGISRGGGGRLITQGGWNMRRRETLPELTQRDCGTCDR